LGKAPGIVQGSLSQYKTRKKANSEVWSVIEPSLPHYLRMYARNFSLLQKSKEEVAVDRSLRAMVDELMENTATIDAESDSDDSTMKPLPRTQGIALGLKR